VFLDPRRLKRLDESTSGHYAGIGVQMDARDSGITVIGALPGTPAERAGIVTGDRIVEIEGRSTHGLTQEEALKALRGAAGSSVQITIERPGVATRLPFTLTRAEIVAYLAALNQPFRDDSSNADPRFTRNRIRHELLPLLKTFNPDVVSALAHLAEHASDAHEVIAMVAAEILAKSERPRAGNAVILDVVALGTSRAVIRAVLRRIWERECWPMSEMDFDAWDRAVEVACGETAACDFPGGISMRHAGRVVQIGLRE